MNETKHQQHPRPPPTIDFTGYNPTQYDPPNSSLQPPNKKRTLSTANGEIEDRQEANSDSRNTAGQSIEDLQLDPALIDVGRLTSGQDTTADRESYKAERRAQLMREAENIREMLAAKERELAELR